jgi:hypothetical protein
MVGSVIGLFVRNGLPSDMRRGPLAGTVRFEESTTAFLDNLVYGAPYKPLIPSFWRAGWSGTADIGDSFAAFLQLRHRKATVASGQASSTPFRRYYDREHRRQSQQYSEQLMLHREAGTQAIR